MNAGTYNIYCEEGATLLLSFTIVVPDPIDPEITTPYNLVGHTARMQVRRTITSSDVMVQLTSGNGLTIDTDNSQIILNMPAQVTSSLTSSGVYDLEIENSNGIVSRVIQGSFTLSPEVTR